MTWWGAYALVILALPVVLVIRWVVADWLRSKRQARVDAGTVQSEDPWHASVILARVKQERADEQAAEAPTEVLPVISPHAVPAQRAQSPDDAPTERLRPVLPKRLPGRTTRPTPYPRQPLVRPEEVLMKRVLVGLERLPVPDSSRHSLPSRPPAQISPARPSGSEVGDTKQKEDC
ncbi:hypothetical protein [Amycolatopsis sp. CB00013]|uniref:hypothetical protein n=1 Tax=Amycolatopsis sp. CB00013 TaxID=1703945 RepID=UPI0009392660|nr:hypothetical protein [Amycolatopsis sp. CB00013]OKJ97406.1 hypothetical protein AMK34_10395 [Amycolatopsis sp. CB00013]